MNFLQKKQHLCDLKTALETLLKWLLTNWLKKHVIYKNT